MASRKEYELLFALNARMNGSFGAPFSKAQAEFSRTGKEIQALHQVQNDISSYQKQQSAIEATRSKLENLQKQHDLLQKEIGETDGSTIALEREKAKLEQRIRDTESALERQSNKLDNTSARLREAGVNTANLSQKGAELTDRIKELQSEQEQATNSAQSFGEKSAAAFDAIGQSIITSKIIDTLGQLKDAYMECIGIAGGFEAAMSTVEALSGANAREMAALIEEAKNLGATTKFTAQEAADAMGYMAMAGWDAQQMMAGMDGVIQLAAAAGEDLAMVSDIVTDNLTAFGLTASDTARFADVLAAAATNSNTSVSVMGETFKQSASVAGALGYRVEDVAVAVGLMANSGVKGSIAGTALKNMFNGLLEGATLTSAAFGEYEFSAIKADGTMKDFAATIDELRVYFDQMTEAERVNNAMTLAGQRGYNGLLAILNATDEDYASLTNSINNCSGAAERMANIKLDNLNGQLVLMNSAWDGLKTTIGEQFIPEMRNLYEVGTDVFGGIDKFIQENPGVIKGISTGATIIGTVTAGLMAYSAGAKIAASASALLSASIPGVNIIMGVTAAVASVVGVVSALTTSTENSIPSVQSLTEAARDMQGAMSEAENAYQQTAAQTVAAAELANTYIDKLNEIEAATGGNIEGNQEYQDTLALLLRAMPELADSISETTDEYGRATYTLATTTDALRANAEAWRKNAEAQAYQEYLNSLYDEYNAVMLESTENRIKLTEAETAYTTAEQKRGEAIRRIMELQREGEKEAQEYFRKTGILVDSSYFTAQNQEYAELVAAVGGYEEEMKKAEKTASAYREALDEDTEAIAEAESEFENAKQIIQQLTGATEEQTEAEAEAAAQAQEIQGIISGTSERLADLSDAYIIAYGDALDSIVGQYELWEEAAAVTETSAATINSALESQVSYWRDYNANLQSLTERSADIEGLSAVIASFADGSQSSVNAIAGLANASDEELRKMVANWQELEKEQEAAAGSVADLKTNFSAVMDELQAALEEDIEAMDLGDEASASARATILGYINGANAMLPQVESAYKQVARTAVNALGTASHTGAYGASSGAYASGTDNARPGWALVGEEGPELLFFHGGEKVLNATQTAALQASPSPVLSASADHFTSPTPTVQVVFNLNGNASPETVSALQKYEDDFVERVLEVIQNAATDNVRSAYR